MSPFDELLLKTLDRARRDQAGSTASTRAIAARLPMAVPERSLRYYLGKLERYGAIHRPLGPKSGWALAAAA